MGQATGFLMHVCTELTRVRVSGDKLLLLESFVSS